MGRSRSDRSDRSETTRLSRQLRRLQNRFCCGTIALILITLLTVGSLYAVIFTKAFFKDPTCWDINQNGACDLREDKNGDGRCNSEDCFGFSCWDLNYNGVCDLRIEDTNGDGTCNVTDCRGADGYDCWDENLNRACDNAEDKNNDGECDIQDCQSTVQIIQVSVGGASTGSGGGYNGTNGRNCWDIDGDGVCDTAEDINSDGACNVTDCRGLTGLACWDDNANGECDSSEDTNNDNVCDTLDCKCYNNTITIIYLNGTTTGGSGGGYNGTNGINGVNGTDGYHCYDLNQNHACDLGTEDTNGDGVCNVTDCRGAIGATGPSGVNGTNGRDGVNGTIGYNGTNGYHCYDTNQNHACDLITEDINGDGACNVSDCQCQSCNGTGSGVGPQGPAGADGYSCFDLNQNNACDLASEDINNDGVCNVTDCRGATGPAGINGTSITGPAGTNGTNGYHCYDLNQNYVCDLVTEDINGDGVCNVTDCKGTAGPAGVNGTNGLDGYHCYDLNQNHACDLGTEDINGDGVCNVTDCKGAVGATGPAGVNGTSITGPAGLNGTNGLDGYHCYDLNQNRACDLGTEDINGDGVCNVTDCKGATGSTGPAGVNGTNGATGPAGTNGTNGYNCFDLNQNGVCDLATEDINGDGACNVTDCRGATGPQGPAGSSSSIALTTKGDLLTYNSTATTRLPVGADNYVLTASSAAAVGISWSPVPLYFSQFTILPIATVNAAYTYTASDIIVTSNIIIRRSGLTGAVTDKFPTAAAMVAALPTAHKVVGHTRIVYIANADAQGSGSKLEFKDNSIDAGSPASVTIVGGSIAILNGRGSIFLIYFSNVSTGTEAAIVYTIGADQ